MSDEIHGVTLVGKVVVLKPECYKGDDKARLFKCEDGFGCHPQCVGTAVFGHFLSDGERARVERYEILRLATPQEV
jgi:hypothetical protein